MERPWASPDDAGFSLVEVLVSFAMVSILAASLTTSFVGGLRLIQHQGQQQTATRLALDGVELARTLREGVLLTGRARCTVACPDATITGAAPYLIGTERWDGASFDGVAAALPLASGADLIPIDGIGYRRYWYVGRCWQSRHGGACGGTSTDPLLFHRVVVAVTWRDSQCRQSTCTFVTSTLFAGDFADPVFRAA